MIKEKKKNKKKEITLAQELAGYAKTAGISFLVAGFFTVMLSFHARSQMLKNLYTAKDERLKIEHSLAQKIVSNSDLTADINNKNYNVCLQIGHLYELAGDYLKAEYAYYNAYQKSPNGVYNAHLKLATVLILQNKVDDAKQIIDSTKDTNSLRLIRFKTRANIVLGDKFYAEGKFLKAADAYEKAYYYYDRLTKKDKIIKESIRQRLINSYLEASGVIIKNGYNSDAVRFLKKALKYDPENLNIQYRLAIVYSDLDPIIALDYFEPLLNKIPQDIDYNAYTKSLMKAANIADIQGNGIKAKYYRYKVHSFDLYTNRKVVYKDNVELSFEDFRIKKDFFTYKLNAKLKIKNISPQDITKLYADVVLRNGKVIKQSLTITCASKETPLFSNGGETESLTIKMGKNIFTKRELGKYFFDVYLYKDDKYKTLIGSYPINQ